MDESKTERKTKVTSITLPVEWWEILNGVAYFRKIQNDSESKSINSVMLEAMGARIEDLRLEFAERSGRRKPVQVGPAK